MTGQISEQNSLNMLVKRHIRFSIGALLLLMTCIAVLLNREAQRAKAIETTVKNIERMNGQVGFRRRTNMPNLASRVLREYWTQSIDVICIEVYSKEHPEPSYYVGPYAIVDPQEVERVLESSALNDLNKACLWGTAIRPAAISRVCRTTSMNRCNLFDFLLSDDEINNLKKSYPHCDFTVGLRAKGRD